MFQLSISDILPVVNNIAPYFIFPISPLTLDVNYNYTYKVPPYIDPNQDKVILTINLLNATKYAVIDENLIYF